MREFIITAIVALAAAKAKAETEAKLSEQQNKLKSSNNCMITNKRTGYDDQAVSLFKDV